MVPAGLGSVPNLALADRSPDPLVVGSSSMGPDRIRHALVHGVALRAARLYPMPRTGRCRDSAGAPLPRTADRFVSRPLWNRLRTLRTLGGFALVASGRIVTHQRPTVAGCDRRLLLPRKNALRADHRRHGLRGERTAGIRAGGLGPSHRIPFRRPGFVGKD